MPAGILGETEAPTIFSKTTWKKISQATRPRLDQTRDPQLIIEQAEQAQNQDSPFRLIYLANRNGAPGRVEHDNRSPATRFSLFSGDRLRWLTVDRGYRQPNEVLHIRQIIF